MRITNIGLFNSTPAIVRFEPGSSITNLTFTEDLAAFSFSLPICDAFANNPTKDLFDRLGELKGKYAQPWIPNSIAPTETAFQNAKTFVTTLPLTQIDKPIIRVATDGEVNFHWAGPNYQIDLGFYGDGTFSYYGAKSGQASVFGDHVKVESGAPAQLLEIAAA